MVSRYTQGAKRVPCGKCVQCLKRRQNGWAFRLKQESKISESAIFLTLTYDDENIPITPMGLHTLRKSDFQKFMKRLRKTIKNSNIKYYACGEYGTQTQRPHYHAIMFNLPRLWTQDTAKLYETWGQGHLYFGEANIQTMHYVIGYMQKPAISNEIIDYRTGEIITTDRQKEFSLMSKRMGIGYLTPQMQRYHQQKLISYVTLQGGEKTSLPRYFRDKIFNQAQRKIMNEAADAARDIHFEKFFNNDYKHLTSWKQQEIIKHEKKIRLSREKI